VETITYFVSLPFVSVEHSCCKSVTTNRFLVRQVQYYMLRVSVFVYDFVSKVSKFTERLLKVLFAKK
jgi:hypothetical protein